jgi:hypothetical protein
MVDAIVEGEARQQLGAVMNSFFEHHEGSIRWHYRCFDRILLNGLIQPFQQPERVVGFFSTYRQIFPVTRSTLRDIANQFQRWVTERAAKHNIPIVEAPRIVSFLQLRTRCRGRGGRRWANCGLMRCNKTHQPSARATRSVSTPSYFVRKEEQDRSD